ncbi:hypothetical protein [Klenkia taihuensis]|uniref:Uncharacterized protein n=1 Tax=Klenkia taihuensis TaxID=1225127 RepID=A0A1I1GMA1_9ACTN|nr:hypothetical protein [Klenkia taihuensis]GHE09773.1 hypothetical protein GCM10011381_16200 [Klenkia taihuensis]SFC10240.1 hypothetical protein SAMN05661030_0112 [Klenkia taihuensis]
MTTFFIVVGVLVVALLVAMLMHDRRARARGARLDPDVGRQVGRGHANPDAYRGSSGSTPTGWGMGSGSGN